MIHHLEGYRMTKKLNLAALALLAATLVGTPIMASADTTTTDSGSAWDASISVQHGANHGHHRHHRHRRHGH
jgi:hypothetical protein